MPRSFDWISALSCSSLTLLLPSKAMRLMTGFSTTVTMSRPPWMVGRTSWNRPVAIQRLHAFVDLEGVEPAARAGPEIGANGIGLDPPVALDDDRVDGRLAHRRAAPCTTTRRRTDNTPPRTKPANASPRISRTPSLMPHAPFVVPSVAARSGPTRKVVPPRASRSLLQRFSSVQTFVPR